MKKSFLIFEMAIMQVVAVLFFAAARSSAQKSKTQNEAPEKQSARLPDPGAGEIKKIILKFAEKETEFKNARNNYTYTQKNFIEEGDGDKRSFWEIDWDITYADDGSRIEKVIYYPQSSLINIDITQEDRDAMRNIEPFVLTSSELPKYDVTYQGHEKLDEITVYVFSVKPKKISKGQQYFQGSVWVDDKDLQIVKSAGENVPDLNRGKAGLENLFPGFITYRKQIDGKYWFPVLTISPPGTVLYFTDVGRVPIKTTIIYGNYKKFKTKSRILLLNDAPEK